MPYLKEGFKGQRLIAISAEILENAIRNPLAASLYITKTGFFPSVKYHYNKKENGADYCILVYCTAGEGWYQVDGKEYRVGERQFFILPAHVPYSFGADSNRPWTIYWIHFKGKLASEFCPSAYLPQSVPPGENTRVQDRTQVFEEIYKNLELSYHSDHYAYASLCLFYFLASFKYPEAFRLISSKPANKLRFSEKVIHYMRENVERNLSLDEFAGHFKLSPSQFSARFRKETNQSPIKYFILLKIEKACEYLEFTNLKVSEIYQVLGFQDIAYFCRMFKKVMGVSPKTYKTNAGTNI